MHVFDTYEPISGIAGPFCRLVKTGFGPVAILWSVLREGPKICRVLISKPDAPADETALASYPRIPRETCAMVDSLAGSIEAFLAGGDITFSLDDVRMDLCTRFQEKVLRAEHAIPRGRVSTYGGIAAHLSIPAGARAVGTALATNPFPIIIPCHRAIRSDGTLGGYQGGLAMKRALLEKEGIPFSPGGRIDPGFLFSFQAEAGAG